MPLLKKELMRKHCINDKDILKLVFSFTIYMSWLRVLEICAVQHSCTALDFFCVFIFSYEIIPSFADELSFFLESLQQTGGNA